MSEQPNEKDKNENNIIQPLHTGTGMGSAIDGLHKTKPKNHAAMQFKRKPVKAIEIKNVPVGAYAPEDLVIALDLLAKQQGGFGMKTKIVKTMFEDFFKEFPDLIHQAREMIREQQEAEDELKPRKRRKKK